MFLRKHIRPISILLLFCLLAGYSKLYLRESGEEIIVTSWNRTFYGLGPDCVYWIAMRLSAWILIYLRLLRLESGISIYLFLRQRSYVKVFVDTYIGCIGMAVSYYCIGTLIMAICYAIILPGIDAGSLLWQSGLLLILAEEELEALNFCLTAYVVYCLFQKAEVGFGAVLTSRVLLNFITGGIRPELPIQMIVNLVMTGLVFLMAFRNFAEKYIDG